MLSKVVLRIFRQTQTRKMSIDIGGMRKPYLKEKDAFEVEDLVSKEPYKQFENWFEHAKTTPGIEEANAMCIATASKQGLPSARYVLLKAFGVPSEDDKGGFVFYTNYNSRKGKELLENPHAALVFYWEPLKRSVRIEGTVEKVSKEISQAYFESRPVGSQIGAAVSNQSQVIPNRGHLLDKEAKLKSVYGDGSQKMEKPEEWGGFRVLPNNFEFWQGQSTRIHDRIVFRKRINEDEKLDANLTAIGENGWLIERLSP